MELSDRVKSELKLKYYEDPEIDVTDIVDISLFDGDADIYASGLEETITTYFANTLHPKEMNEFIIAIATYLNEIGEDHNEESNEI